MNTFHLETAIMHVRLLENNKWNVVAISLSTSEI
jgi:hypothetical protein